MTTKIEKLLFYSLILFLPTQLGKHFWPEFSLVSGIRVDYLSPTLYFTDVLVVGLFCVWFINVILSGSRIAIVKELRFREILDSARMTARIIFLLVLLLLVLNILLSSNILGGYYSLLKFLEFSFVAYYVATFIKEKKQTATLAMLFSLGILFESGLAIYQYVAQGSLGGLLYFLGERTFTSATPGIANASLDGRLVLRPYGTFPHPNVLAGYLVAGLVLLGGATRTITPSSSPLSGGETKRPFLLRGGAKGAPSLIREGGGGFYKLLFFAAFLFGSLALLLTMSRVAIVFGVVSFIVVLLKRLFYSSSERRESRSAVLDFITFRSNNKARVFIFTLFLVFSSLFLVFSSPLLPRFSQTSFSEEAFVHREKLMDAAAVMINNHLFTGIGLGNFLPTLSTIQSPLSLGLYLQPVHNIYLLVAAELGVIGFVVFIWFLVKTFAHALSHRENRVFAIMLLSVIVLGFFDHYFLTLQQGQMLFAVIVGLCWTKLKT